MGGRVGSRERLYVEFLYGAGGKAVEVNLRQTKIAPLPEAELIALGIAR